MLVVFGPFKSICGGTRFDLAGDVALSENSCVDIDLERSGLPESLGVRAYERRRS
jgi:hypothetical protein